MAKVTKWQVTEWEFERGWGSKVFDITQYDSLAEAKAAQEACNAQNTATEVPDWYIMASDPVEVEVECDIKDT